MQCRVRRRREDGAAQIEGDEWQTSHRIFHVVAENPEIQHVAAEVDPAVVKECARDGVRP
jgi:hypothetical protein